MGAAGTTSQSNKNPRISGHLDGALAAIMPESDIDSAYNDVDVLMRNRDHVSKLVKPNLSGTYAALDASIKTLRRKNTPFAATIAHYFTLCASFHVSKKTARLSYLKDVFKFLGTSNADEPTLTKFFNIFFTNLQQFLICIDMEDLNNRDPSHIFNKQTKVFFKLVNYLSPEQRKIFYSAAITHINQVNSKSNTKDTTHQTIIRLLSPALRDERVSEDNAALFQQEFITALYNDQVFHNSYLNINSSDKHDTALAILEIFNLTELLYNSPDALSTLLRHTLNKRHYHLAIIFNAYAALENGNERLAESYLKNIGPSETILFKLYWTQKLLCRAAGKSIPGVTPLITLLCKKGLDPSAFVTDKGISLTQKIFELGLKGNAEKKLHSHLIKSIPLKDLNDPSLQDDFLQTASQILRTDAKTAFIDKRREALVMTFLRAGGFAMGVSTFFIIIACGFTFMSPLILGVSLISGLMALPIIAGSLAVLAHALIYRCMRPNFDTLKINRSIGSKDVKVDGSKASLSFAASTTPGGNNNATRNSVNASASSERAPLLAASDDAPIKQSLLLKHCGKYQVKDKDSRCRSLLNKIDRQNIGFRQVRNAM